MCAGSSGAPAFVLLGGGVCRTPYLCCGVATGLQLAELDRQAQEEAELSASLLLG